MLPDVYRYPDMCGYTSPYYNKREVFIRISTSLSDASGRDGRLVLERVGRDTGRNVLTRVDAGCSKGGVCETVKY